MEIRFINTTVILQIIGYFLSSFLSFSYQFNSQAEMQFEFNKYWYAIWLTQLNRLAHTEKNGWESWLCLRDLVRLLIKYTHITITISYIKWYNSIQFDLNSHSLHLWVDSKYQHGDARISESGILYDHNA